MSNQAKTWHGAKHSVEPKLNPLSPQSDNYCEKLYKSYLDSSAGQPGVFQDRIVRICEQLDIDTQDLLPRKYDEFTDDGRIEADLAKVRFEHYASKRKAKLIAINQKLQNPNGGSLLGQNDKRGGHHHQGSSDMAMYGKMPFQTTQNSPKQARKVLFITGLDMPSTYRRDLINASPLPNQSKKLKGPFGGHTNPSKSALGNFSSTQVAQHSPPPHNSSSLPDIGASEQLLREMQREKERLNRYFKSKERIAKQMENFESKAQALLKKKASKMAKIEDKKKKEIKEIREKAEVHDETRLAKLRNVKEIMNDHVRHGQELYLQHLDEVKSWKEAKQKRQREACEISYRRHQDNMAKSMGKQHDKNLETLQTEIMTQRNLQELQQKIQTGFARSLQQKEQMRYHAQGTLVNFETVIEAHNRIQEDEESKKLLEYLSRKKKKMAHFQKWEKLRAASFEATIEKRNSKLGQAKANNNDAQDELLRLGETIEAKFNDHNKRMEEFKQKRDRENMIRHEKEHLRFEDQQKNVERQKKQKELEKYKIIEKQIRMEEKLMQIKETKAHLLEYHRMANEVRLQRTSVIGQSNTSPHH